MTIPAFFANFGNLDKKRQVVKSAIINAGESS